MEQKKKIYPNVYETTGNPAVDMIASAVTYYKGASKQIKNIVLREDYYELFMEWVKKYSEVDITTELTFENILISKSFQEIEEPIVLSF